MASSGTNTFNLSVDELILEAYERCGIVTPTGYQLRSARRSLNLLLQDLGNRDLHLFKRSQTTFNTVASDETYVLATSILDVMDMHVLAGGTTGSVTRSLNMRACLTSLRKRALVTTILTENATRRRCFFIQPPTRCTRLTILPIIESKTWVNIQTLWISQ